MTAEKLIMKKSNLLVFILDKYANFKMLKAIILSLRPKASENIFPKNDWTKNIDYNKFPLWDIRTDPTGKWQT